MILCNTPLEAYIIYGAGCTPQKRYHFDALRYLGHHSTSQSSTGFYTGYTSFGGKFQGRKLHFGTQDVKLQDGFELKIFFSKHHIHRVVCYVCTVVSITP